MSFFRLIKDHSGCCILDQLQRLDSTCGKARQESITIVQSGENKSLDKELCGSPYVELTKVIMSIVMFEAGIITNVSKPGRL